MLATVDTRPGDRSAPARKPRTVPGGRPPISDKGKADAVIRFRLTQEEKAAIEDAAQKAGVKPSEWMRNHLLKLAEKSSKKRRTGG
ncbi:MAG: hypothetical protein AAGG38_15380 [Planctomycetota bacterium]